MSRQDYVPHPLDYVPNSFRKPMGYLSLQDVGCLICRGAFHRVFRDDMPILSVKNIEFTSAVHEWERQPAENSWLSCNERGLISVNRGGKNQFHLWVSNWSSPACSELQDWCVIRFITKWQPHVTCIRKKGCQGFVYLTLTANYPGLLLGGRGTGNDERQRPVRLNQRLRCNTFFVKYN